MFYKGKSKVSPPLYTYSFLAKQPIHDYKIRLRKMEQMRVERLRMGEENDFKSLTRHNQHKEIIEIADKKYVYNRIKKLVDCGMKANEHLFIEELSKPKPKKEKEQIQPKIHTENILEKENESKKKIEEEERKLVKEKRLQLFIESSEELRSAAITKRKRDIANINYRMIQEKERINKELKVKKRESCNFENLELIRIQTLEKKNEKQKLMKKKEQFRKELNDQVQQKELIKKQEKEFKNIESYHFKKLNEKLKEEEENEKLERIKKQIQRKEEIKQFTEARAKLFAKTNKVTKTPDEIFPTTTQQNFKDDTIKEIEAKIQMRRENEMFRKYHAMVKEERKKQSEEISEMVRKQMDEIEDLKKSIERECDEARRKRKEESNKTLKEQLKLREILLEQQKDIKRKTYEQSVKEYEEYLKEEKQLWEKKKQFKWQIRKDLNDQIKSRNDIIEKQRKIDSENHEKCMLEFTEQEKLLNKLLSEL